MYYVRFSQFVMLHNYLAKSLLLYIFCETCIGWLAALLRSQGVRLAVTGSYDIQAIKMIRAISVPNPYGPIFIEPALPRNKYDAMIFPFSHGFKRGGIQVPRALGDSQFHDVYIRTAQKRQKCAEKLRISAVGVKSPLKNFEQPASSGALL